MRSQNATILFRPQLFYQEILPEHVCPAGLEFKMNMETGKNYGRIPNEATLPDNAEEAACMCVQEEKEDADNVIAALKLRASWGDVDGVKHVLRSCYVSRRMTDDALCEAAAFGFEHIIILLLKVGGRPTATCGDKTALHWACQNGHETCIRILVVSMENLSQFYIKDARGLTGLDYLRSNDELAKADRIEEFAKLKFETKDFLAGKSPTLLS